MQMAFVNSIIYKATEPSSSLKKGEAFGKIFIESAVGYKLITGNTYIWANRLESGKVAELVTLPSQYVAIISDGTINGVEYWLSAWLKVSKDGAKFMSLSIKNKSAESSSEKKPVKTKEFFNDSDIPF